MLSLAAVEKGETERLNKLFCSSIRKQESLFENLRPGLFTKSQSEAFLADLENFDLSGRGNDFPLFDVSWKELERLERQRISPAVDLSGENSTPLERQRVFCAEDLSGENSTPLEPGKKPATPHHLSKTNVVFRVATARGEIFYVYFVVAAGISIRTFLARFQLAATASPQSGRSSGEITHLLQLNTFGQINRVELFAYGEAERETLFIFNRNGRFSRWTVGSGLPEPVVIPNMELDELSLYTFFQLEPKKFNSEGRDEIIGISKHLFFLLSVVSSAKSPYIELECLVSEKNGIAGDISYHRPVLDSATGRIVMCEIPEATSCLTLGYQAFNPLYRKICFLSPDFRLEKKIPLSELLPDDPVTVSKLSERGGSLAIEEDGRGDIYFRISFNSTRTDCLYYRLKTYEKDIDQL